MILAGFFREKAVDCRRLAHGLPEDEPSARQLLAMADEFDRKAVRYMN